jgi:ATP-dependent Clp protease ATP-binding subunit ClpA
MKLMNPARDARVIKTLLEAAEAEAERAGEREPGAEHLLLAALDLPEGSARRAFAAVGADPDGLRAAIAGRHADALRAIGIEPPDDDDLDAAVAAAPPRRRPAAFKSTAPARAAFQRAAELSRSVKGMRFTGAHVVAAVAEQHRGTAARALTAMGIDRAALAAAARAEAGVPAEA